MTQNGRRDREWLKQLVTQLQEDIRYERLTKAKIDKAIKDLDDHDYRYDHDKFPPLVHAVTTKEDSCDSPTTPAEALLWKLGRWPAYKNFVAFHKSESAVSSNSRSVVFDSFALHLKDENNPIFDQHALRAVWAISQMSAADEAKCAHFLLDRTRPWKESGTGKFGAACYWIFCRRARALVRMSEASLADIDKLLMPLGQAIKDLSANHGDFCELCGKNPIDLLAGKRHAVRDKRRHASRKPSRYRTRGDRRHDIS
jgi:hypothetical protein